MTVPDTPAARGKRVARETLDGILPRLAAGLGPVDLAALARRVEEEIEAALAQRAEAATLFDREE